MNCANIESASADSTTVLQMNAKFSQVVNNCYLSSEMYHVWSEWVLFLKCGLDAVFHRMYIYTNSEFSVPYAKLRDVMELKQKNKCSLFSHHWEKE